MDCDERGEAINKKAANRSSKGLKIKKVWRERERERERERLETGVNFSKE